MTAQVINAPPEPSAARAAIRRGTHTGPTSGLAPGWAQANLVVLPAEEADEFRVFCEQNPKPCPLIEVVDSAHPVTAASGADLRTDIPRYRVFRDGDLDCEPTDVTDMWRDDMTAFLIGCSFTFEAALADAGLPIAHQQQGVNVPMYVTNVACTPVGHFSGPTVASMRPFSAANAERAEAISARFPAMHGAPIHIGDATKLGITDLGRPDFGDPVTIAPGEVPVFWACGVTPQVVALHARPALAIFHAPGHMFITDLPHTHFDTEGQC